MPIPGRYASVDIGTNSVKMTIAEIDAKGNVKALAERSKTTRLGEGIYAGRLRETAMRRTAETLTEFAALCKELGVRDVAAAGTAALRDAANADEFQERVREQCGWEIEIVSGETEARLSYMAVRRDPAWKGWPHLVVMDVGGGSSEVIEGEPMGEEIASRVSVNIGAVKLTEAHLLSDPPTISQLNAAHEAARAAFSKLMLRPGKTSAVAVGGTIVNLAAVHAKQTALDPDALHGTTLTLDDVEDQIALYGSRIVEERKAIPGLDPSRADIILGGAILFAHLLSRLGCDTVGVSIRGLRWGLLYDRFL